LNKVIKIKQDKIKYLNFLKEVLLLKKLK